jgi:hypothetical protein
VLALKGIRISGNKGHSPYVSIYKVVSIFTLFNFDAFAETHTPKHRLLKLILWPNSYFWIARRFVYWKLTKKSTGL